jgi:hypothetical protein
MRPRIPHGEWFNLRPIPRAKPSFQIDRPDIVGTSRNSRWHPTRRPQPPAARARSMNQAALLKPTLHGALCRPTLPGKMFSQPPAQLARTPTRIPAPCAQHPFAPPRSLPRKRPLRGMRTILQTQPAVRSKPGQKPISDRPAHAPPTANCRHWFNVGHHRLYQFASLAKYRRVFPWHSPQACAPSPLSTILWQRLSTILWHRAGRPSPQAKSLRQTIHRIYLTTEDPEYTE